MNKTHLPCSAFPQFRMAPLSLLTFCVMAAAWPHPARGDTIIKANNGDDLNFASSWVTNGPPGPTDIAQWDGIVDGSVPGAASPGLGNSLQHWQGLVVTGAVGGNVSIDAGHQLQLGAAGVLHMPTANRTLTLSCDVAMTDTQTWSIATSRTATLAGTLSGLADLTKHGAGTLTLGAANTFTGRTTVAGGLLVISADTRLGAVPTGFTSDALTLDGGALRASALVTLDPHRGITLGAAGGTLDANGGAFTVPAPIAGLGPLTKAGAQPLILSATNTYNGGTLVSAGTLRVDDGIGLPLAGNLNLAGGVWESGAAITRTLGTGAGELQLTASGSGFSANGAPINVNLHGGAALSWGSSGFTPASLLTLNSASANNTLTLQNAIDLNAATARTLQVNAANAEVAGTLANSLAGGLTKTGAGRLILSGTNTFSGPTIVSAGSLQAADGVGLASGGLTISGGIFEPIGTFTRPVGTNAGDVQIIGAVAGGFSAQSSNTTIAITGPLTWGSATFNPNPLVLNTADATHPLTFASDLVLNGAARVIQVNTNQVTVTGVISHHTAANRLQKTGIGTLILTATNTWSHTQGFATNLYVTAGVVQVEREENLGGTPATFQARNLLVDGGALRTTASFAIDDANRGLYIGANDLRLIVDPDSTLTIAAPIDGAAGSALIKDGAGQVVLANVGNNYGTGSGGRTEFVSGTIQIAADGNLGNPLGDIIVSGDSTLFATDTTTLTSGRLVSINTNWTIAVTNGAALTIAGAMNESIGAGGSLIKRGAGTLVLSGNNDWNSATLIAEGTLKFGALNALPDTAGGNVTIAANATLDVNGFGGTICSIDGAGTIDNTVGVGPYTLSVGINAASTTFDGVIQNSVGTLALTKVGAGTLTLASPATYSGNTTIATGTLKLGAPNVIPNGTAKGDVAVTGILDLGGFDETINGLTGGGVVTNSTGTATLTLGDNHVATAFSGLLRDGTGTLGVTKIGAGMVTLSGANTYSGDTTISVGTLRASAGNAIPDGPGRGNVTVVAGATLDIFTTEVINGLSGAGTVNNSIASARILTVGGNDQSSLFSGSITNTGGPASLLLTKTGNGTLVLAGPNGYGGATTIAAGTLQIGDDGATGSLGTAAVANHAALVFRRADATALNVVVSGTGTVTQAGAGTLQLNAAGTWTGVTGVEAGILQLGASERIANASPLRIAGGTFDLLSFNETVGPVTLESGTLTSAGSGLTGTVYNVESGTLAAHLGGNAALIKSTTGLAAIMVANTYTGGTTIHDGTLLVNNPGGSGTGSGDVTVHAGGRLGGNGAIAGAVTLNNGATLSPGASLGTLTVGSLAVAPGVTNVFEFGPGAVNDQVVVTTHSGLTLNGGDFLIHATGTTDPWTTDGIYPLIQYTGPIGGTGIDSLGVLNPQPGKEYVFATLDGWVVLIISSLGLPDVTNGSGASGISAHAATLNGFLVATGGAPTSVTIYWGTTDGGTNPAAWTASAPLGIRPAGSFSTTLSPPWLEAARTYFYRSFASNAAGADWAESSTNFTTRAEDNAVAAMIDPDIMDATDEYGPSPSVVFTDYSVGYVFYIDGPAGAGGSVTYRKTLDGGATWGEPVSLGDDQDDGSVAVWYDRWTPGDSDTRIHLAHIGSGTLNDTLRYNDLDTATDTAGTWRTIRLGPAWAAGNAAPSITKTTTGRLFAYVGMTHLGTNMTIVSHSDDGATWTPADVGDPGAATDGGQLLPLSGGDVLLLQLRAGTVDRLRSAVWSNSLETWSPWTTNETIEADATFLSQWGATLQRTSGDVFVTAHSDVNASVGRLNLYRFSAGSRTWSFVTNIVDDTSRQITSATLLTDDASGDLYAVYARQQSGIGVTNPTNVFTRVRHSADNGQTWSAESTVSSDSGLDLRIVRGNLLQNQRLYAVWYDEDNNDLYGNTVMDLSPTRLRITCNGVDNLTPHSAVLKGNLASDGGSPANVWLYWGSTNVGLSRTGWEHSANLGSPGTGLLATAVANLSHITRYHYVYYATNAAGEAWADTIPTFRTPLDKVMIGGTNDFGRNMDYETFGLAWFNQRNEAHSYSPAQQGITPIADDGVQMIQFLAADSDGFNCDIHQRIDLSDYVEVITNGEAFCEFTTHFNGAVPGTRMEIALWLDANTPGGAGAGAYSSSILLDGDLDSWQLVSASSGPVQLPPTTRYVTLGFKIFGDVEGATFSGHFSDKGRFTVIFPVLDRPPPSGFQILLR